MKPSSLLRIGVSKSMFLPSGRVQWIVVGENRDYLICEAVGYCHCEDFYQAVMDGRVEVCKHLFAWKLATNNRTQSQGKT